MNAYCVYYDDFVQHLFDRRENKSLSYQEFCSLIQTIRANIDNYYSSFMTKKDRLSYRVICAPQGPLKDIQKNIAVFLSSRFIHHPSSFGFQKNKDIKANALLHTNKGFVFNVDIKDFFASVRFGHFLTIYEENNEILNFDIESLNLIKEICFISIQNGQMNIEGQSYNLPQGAPTSPILSNIFFHSLDQDINNLCNEYGISYSRYVDDLSFSGKQNIFQYESVFRNRLESLLDTFGLKLNAKKIKLYPPTKKQIVTGLIVNEGINVDRKYVKNIRKWTYIAERYGKEKLAEKYSNEFLKNNPNKWQYPQDAIIALKSKIAYYGYIKGYDNQAYRDLKSRIDKIISKNSINLITNLEFDNFSDVIYGVKYFYLSCFDGSDNYIQQIKLPVKYFLKYRWNVKKVKDDFHLPECVKYYHLVPKTKDFDFFALRLNFNDTVYYELHNEQAWNTKGQDRPNIDIAVYIKDGKVVAKGTQGASRKVIGIVPSTSAGTKLSPNMIAAINPLKDAAVAILKKGAVTSIIELGTDTVSSVHTLPDHEFGNKRDITPSELKNADEIFVVELPFAPDPKNFDAQGRVVGAIFKYGPNKLQSEPVPAHWIGSVVIRVDGKLYKLDTKPLNEIPTAMTILNEKLQAIKEAQLKNDIPSIVALVNSIRNIVQYRTSESKFDTQTQGKNVEGKKGLGPKIEYYSNDAMPWQLDGVKFATLEEFTTELTKKRIQIDSIRLNNAKYQDNIAKVLQTDLSEAAFERGYRTAPSVYVKGNITLASALPIAPAANVATPVSEVEANQSQDAPTTTISVAATSTTAPSRVVTIVKRKAPTK